MMCVWANMAMCVCAGVRELGMFDIFKWSYDFEKCFASWSLQFSK